MNYNVQCYYNFNCYQLKLFIEQISIMQDGKEIFHSALEEEILREEDDHPDVVPPFNAYSVAGEPEVRIMP